MNIINSYRFGAGGPPTPTHFWNLNNVDAVDSGDGLYDQGSKRDANWDLNNTNCTASAGTGPNSQDVLNFDDSAYLDRTNIAWDGDNNDQWSMSAWMKMDVIDTLYHFGPCWRTGSEGVGQIYIDGPGDDNAAGLMFSLAGLILADGATTTVSAGTWYHLVVTANYDGDIIVYQNGTAIETVDASAATTITTATLGFTIGTAAHQKGNANTNFNGLMFGVGIWDVELTADDVTALYGGGTSGDGYYADFW